MIEIIKKALITLKRAGVFGQCSFMGSTTRYESIYPYGTYAIPKVNSMVILQSVLGDESLKVGIEYDNKKVAAISALLQEGDTAVYNPESNSHIIFRSNGDIEIKAEGSMSLKITADTKHTGDMEITGDLTVTGDVTVTGILTAGGKNINTHVHTAGSFNIGGVPVVGTSGTMV